MNELKVTVAGSGEAVRLTDRDFIHSGREGTIYRQGALAYKIYHHPAQVPAEGKLRELYALYRPNIVRPLALVLDSRGRSCGIRMAFAEGEPLCRLFTTGYQRIHGLSPDALTGIAVEMAATFAFIHKKGCLVVDGNEMNILVGTDLTPYFLDVDSYQTPSYPPTAFHPATRDPLLDPKRPRFSRESDYFVLAVVTFQLFVGLHPFGGSHPDFARGDIPARMAAGVSLFDPQVSLPAAARPLTVIPENFRAWYQVIFAEGRRLPPPGTPGTVLTVTSTAPPPGEVRLEKIFRTSEKLLGASGEFVYGEANIYDLSGCSLRPRHPGEMLLPSPITRRPLGAYLEQGRLHLVDPAGARIGAPIPARAFTLGEGDLYVLAAEHLQRLEIFEAAGRLVATIGSAWPVLPHATRLLEGVAAQATAKAPWLLLPYRDARGRPALLQRPFEELRGAQVLEAKHRRGVLLILAVRDDQYELHRWRFDGEYRTCDHRMEKKAPFQSLNLAVLENGVAVYGDAEGNLELFEARPGCAEARRLASPRGAGLTLFAHGATAYGLGCHTLYRLRT